MNVDYQKIVAELQGQRNQAMDAHAVAAARAAQMAEHLAIAQVKIAELEAKMAELEAKMAEPQPELNAV